MTAGISALVLAATAFASPGYVPACELEYSWSIAPLTFEEGSTEVAPGTDEPALRPVLAWVRNGAARPVEFEVTIPTGGKKWVRLETAGMMDPPVGAYVGNATLTGVRCPTLFPTASHMVAAGGGFGGSGSALFSAVAEEFGIGAAEVATAAAPSLGSTLVGNMDLLERAGLIAELVDAFGAASDDEVLQGLGQGGWADEQLAEAWGAYILHWEGIEALGFAVQRLRAMGMDAKAIMDAMERWDAGGQLWYWTAQKGAALLGRGGFSHNEVAHAYQSSVGNHASSLYSALHQIIDDDLEAPQGTAAQLMMDEFGASAPDLFSWSPRRTFGSLGALGWSLASRCARAGEGITPEKITTEIGPELGLESLVSCLSAAGADAETVASSIWNHRQEAVGSTSLEAAAGWLRTAGYDADDAALVLETLSSVYWQDTAVRIVRGLILAGYAAAPALQSATDVLAGPEAARAVSDLVDARVLARGLAAAYVRASHADIARWLAGTEKRLDECVDIVAHAFRLSEAARAELLTELGLKGRGRL